MKKKVIRIFLLVLMVLLASKIDAHAVLIDNVKSIQANWTKSVKNYFSSNKVKANLTRQVGQGEEKEYEVEVKTEGDTELTKSSGTSITNITVTPKGGQSFYYGDRLHIDFSIALYHKFGVTGAVTDIFDGTIPLKSETKTMPLKDQTSQYSVPPYVSFCKFSPCIFNLKEGDNVFTAKGGTKDLKEQITIKIPNVKKEEEKRKTLVADSEEEIVSRLKGAKQYRLIVPPNVVPPPQSGTKKIDAKATAAEQIYSTFPEISRLEAKEKIEFKQTSKEDETEDETLLVDSSGQYISLLGCKVSFIITPEKTRKVDMVGVTGYTDGKASLAWFEKNVSERKRN